jgi:hypothetical protein
MVLQNGGSKPPLAVGFTDSMSSVQRHLDSDSIVRGPHQTGLLYVPPKILSQGLIQYPFADGELLLLQLYPRSF